MPKDAAATEFGDLFVQFKVVDVSATSTDSLSDTERRELRRLLRKLEGKESSTTTTVQEWPFDMDDASKTDTSLHRHRLHPASRSEFGRGHNRRNYPGDDDNNNNKEQEFFGSSGGLPGFMPFGSAQQQQQQRYFWSSSAASNPFFGNAGPDFAGDDDAGESQCRQM